MIRSRSGASGARTALGCLLLTLAASAGCEDRDASPAARRDPAVVEDAAAAEGRRTLLQIVAAEQSLAYTGYKSTISGRPGEGRATRMRIARYPAGPTLLEWDQDGGPTRRWVYRRRFAWMEDPELLLRNYTVEVAPEPGPSVAWRETRVVRVRGRSAGRPSLDLWIDRETSLVLRDELTGCDGRSVTTSVFETIDYAPPAAPLAEADAERLPEPTSPPGSWPSMPLAVTSAPGGFTVVHRERSADGSIREDWSDGLAAFCVLQTTRVPSCDGQGAPKEGEVRRRGCGSRAQVSGLFGGVWVEVAGALPAADLEAVIRGLAPGAGLAR